MSPQSISPLKRLFEFANSDEFGVLILIPLVYVAGGVLWVLFGLGAYAAIGASSLMALGVLVDVLFLNPPR